MWQHWEGDGGCGWVFLPVEAACFSLTVKLMLMHFGLCEELHSGEIYLPASAMFLQVPSGPQDSMMPRAP